METREEAETPVWAMAVLFWRKVEMLERRGIPGARPEPATRPVATNG